MNILVVDSQGLLTGEEVSYAKERLFYSLLRFEYRINGATMHFAYDGKRDRFKCAIHVSLEGFGVLSVKRSGESFDDVVNQTVGAIEPRVARRVDWRGWLNADNFSTWMASLGQPNA